VIGHVINKEGSDATSEPKQQALLAQHHHEASSPAQCNHNLSLLDAGPLSHQISSETCVSHSTISTLHSKYLPHPHRPSGGYSSKLSAADTHHLQQLISSWKAGNAAQNAKALVYTKHQPVTSYNAHFNPKQADLRAMLKKKSHFSTSSMGGADRVCCYTSKLDCGELKIGGIVI